MKKLFVIAVAVATVLSLRPFAQNAPQNARGAIDAAAAAMGTMALQSVQYLGHRVGESDGTGVYDPADPGRGSR